MQKTITQIRASKLKRVQKAIDLVNLGIVKICKSQKAIVVSQTTGKKYHVDFNNFNCECVDFAISKHKNPEHKCKHIIAALIKSGKMEVLQ